MVVLVTVTTLIGCTSPKGQGMEEASDNWRLIGGSAIDFKCPSGGTNVK